MKADWEVKKLGEIIVSNIVGLTKSSSEQDPSGKYKYVKMNNITVDNCFDFTKYVRVDATTQEAEKYGLIRGDFLFNTRNSYELVGKTCVFNEEVDEVTLYNNNIMRIRFTKDVDSTFVNYSFSSEPVKKKLDKLKSGTTNVSAIYFKDLKNLEISLPPIAEQQRIVAILDEAFAAIDQAKANAETNRQNARALFESYLQSVFTNDEWEKKLFGAICQNLDGKRVPITKKFRSEGKYPYYGASGIVDYVDEYIFDESLLLVSEDGANLLARTYPIAFSISGKTWVNNHAHVLRFNNMASQRFVEYYLNSIKLDDHVSGMAQPKLNQRMLNSIPIPYPDITNQQTIVAKLDALSAETKKLEAIYRQKVADLDELKKAILQKAFRGELSKTQGELTNP